MVNEFINPFKLGPLLPNAAGRKVQGARKRRGRDTQLDRPSVYREW